MKNLNDLFVNNESVVIAKTELACLIGLNEAIVLNQVNYWLGIYQKYPEKFQAKHYRDGRWWAFNSYKKWHEQFPFWNVRTIRRIFKKLRDLGIIIFSSEYNEKGYDKTGWYSIDYDVLSRLMDKKSENSEDLWTNCPNPHGQNVHTPYGQNGPTNTIDYYNKDYLPKNIIKDIGSDSNKNEPVDYTSDSGRQTDIGESKSIGRSTIWEGWGSAKDYNDYLNKVLPNKVDGFQYWCIRYFYDTYLERMGEPHPPYNQRNLEKVCELIARYEFGSSEYFEKAVDIFFSKDIQGGYHLLLFLTDGFQENIGYELDRLGA